MLKSSKTHEKKRLEKIAKNFSMKEGFTGKMEKFMCLTLQEHLKDGHILDVGCADGVMVKELSKYYKKFTAIDGSQEIINKARGLKLPNVNFVYTLFEDFNPEEKFDSIILSDILEHIENPVQLLKRAKSWLKDNGVILIISPNSNSLHRQIGVLAKMLKDQHDLNATDKRVGHRRVYDFKLLKQDIQKAGLKVDHYEGILLKPLSDPQMDKLPKEVIEAFYLISKQLPTELSNLLFVKCKK